MLPAIAEPFVCVWADALRSKALGFRAQPLLTRASTQDPYRELSIFTAVP